MAHWDDILLQFIRDTPGVEQQMNKHRLTTNLSHGGLGLRQLWGSYITRWVTIGQQELQRTGPIHQLTATQNKYIDAVRALGGTVGQRISQPRQHRPLSAGLYDSESSEEDQETHAGKTRPATNRLDYSWMNPPEEPTPEETHEVCQALPHQQKLHGITIHYTGEPTTTRWYIDGSKRHGRAGGGIYNGTYRAASRVHGPQFVFSNDEAAVISELTHSRVSLTVTYSLPKDMSFAVPFAFWTIIVQLLLTRGGGITAIRFFPRFCCFFFGSVRSLSPKRRCIVHLRLCPASSSLTSTIFFPCV